MGVAVAASCPAPHLAWCVPAGLVVVTLGTFLPALGAEFVDWDDYINLVNNLEWRGLGWRQLRWAFSSTLLGHYIPLTWLSFGLDYLLWGMIPLGYHLTNLLLHAANAWLVYGIAHHLLRIATALSATARVAAATGTAVFFAVHPLRAESVAWVTERRGLLSGLFFLLTVLFYLRAAQATGAHRRRLLAASVAAYILAVSAKAIVMTLPGVLFLLDVYPLRRLDGRWRSWLRPPVRDVWIEKLPYAGVALVGAAGSFYAHSVQSFLTAPERYPWWARPIVLLESVWFYAYKTLLPVVLSPLYELPAPEDFGKSSYLVHVVAACLTVGLLLALRRRWPAGLAIWTYYVLSLAPVSGLVHAGFQLVADRYSYLACLGLALLAGTGLGLVVDRRVPGLTRPSAVRLTVALAVTWVLAMGVLTWRQVGIWRTTETLWRHAVWATPDCAFCYNALGNWLMARGAPLSALEQFERALAVRPDRIRVRANFGLALLRIGMVTEAVAQFEQVAALLPDWAELRSTLAGALIQLGRPADALRHLDHALGVEPRHVGALVNRGLALHSLGRSAEAVAPLGRALELRPTEALAHLGLMRIYLTLGEPDRARAELERLRRLDPALASAAERELRP